MQRLQNSWTIYPDERAAQKVLDQILASSHQVLDPWQYRIVRLNDGVRCVISVFDEEGQFVGNLP